MNSGVSRRIDKESGNTVPDLVQQGTFGADIPLLEKLQMNATVMQPVNSETQFSWRVRVRLNQQERNHLRRNRPHLK